MGNLTTSQKFLYVAKNVLTSPFSLALWVVGGVVSYYLRSGVPLWIPLVVTVVSQLALLYRRLNDEEYLRKLFMDRQERAQSMTDEQVEAVLEKMDFETRQRVRYILQLQKEILREARGSDVGDYARRDLERMALQIGPVVQRAVGVGMRKQQLARYLNNVDARALQNYCSSLRQRIEATTDPVTKAQYEQALRAREAETQTYQAIEQAARRIDSQLENVEATFASWKAKVIRIKTADVASAAAVSEGLYQELDQLNNDIDLLDTSVAEALNADAEISLRQNS